MSRIKTFGLIVLLMGLGMLLGGCNEATSPAEEQSGGGDYGAVQTATYGDTLFSVGVILGTPNVPFLAIDTNRAGTSIMDTIGYTVTGGSFTSVRGDSTVSHWASSVQVGVGSKTVVSGSYPVYSHDAVPDSPRSNLGGKARLFIYGLPGGMTWSHSDSSGSAARVVVTVAGDSVQVQGKDIKLANGKYVTFNFKTRKTF
jgi:hypothetical protein